jgi:hypothetical protein
MTKQIIENARWAPDPDEARTRAMAGELAALGPMILTLRPHRVLQLAGLLQLADRHRGLSANDREAVRAFLTGARDYFVHCPRVIELLDEGDDPAHDVPMKIDGTLCGYFDHTGTVIVDTPGRKCGECLMNDVEVVALDEHGVCPRCGANYGS